MTTFFDNFGGRINREKAIGRYRLLADRYDASCKRITCVRGAAIELLALKRGETVLDVACGTGSTLPELSRLVGPAGRVIGIEQSPEMALIARDRIAREAPHPNTTIVESAVEAYQADAPADAALLCYTHDVLQSAVALERIAASLRPGARVAVAGLRILPWWWGAPINLFVLFRARRYVTTFRGMREPWGTLAELCPDLRLIGFWHAGTTYLAVGTRRATAIA